MKKFTLFFAFSILLSCGLLFSSCEKEPTPETEITSEEPVEEPTILGHWRMDKATQLAYGNEIDITNFYTQDFQLTFLEDGTLITSNGMQETAMQWTLEGDQLSFIQAPEMDPVIYTVRELTLQNLSIVNGTDFVTTMEFHKE
ncbi:MAG: hypothetical protein MJZ49_07260 [Bacteroidales bacterium]|nr:hypothetical protein [Bacteroidales bacterium]